MAGEIPDGLAIEPVWAIEATYGPDAVERRPAVRHEAAALSILKADVYTRSGVWTGFRARALGRVVRREELETD